MTESKRSGFSFLRCVALRCGISVLLIGSFAADEHEVARRIAGHSADTKIITELHTEPVSPLPDHALREGFPESSQRIEETRSGEGAHRSGFAGLDNVPESGILSGILPRFEPQSLVWAGIYTPQLSFSHLDITDRYPIPPPTISAAL